MEILIIIGEEGKFRRKKGENRRAGRENIPNSLLERGQKPAGVKVFNRRGVEASSSIWEKKLTLWIVPKVVGGRT